MRVQATTENDNALGADAKAMTLSTESTPTAEAKTYATLEKLHT